MALGHPQLWIPTPLEVGAFFTVWPLIFGVATALALIPPMWLICGAVALARRIRRR